MKILHRAYEIRKKKKNNEELTLDEQMIYDMDKVLNIISECLISYDKGATIDYTIENIRSELDIINKWYEKENKYDK